MKTLTPQQIVDLGPCEGYDLKYVTELFGNKKSMTYLEILDTNKIPLEDIIWVFCQPTVLDDDIKKQWLEIIVTRAVTNCALHCGIEKVEKWATNWLNGDDRTAKTAYIIGTAADYAFAAGYTPAYAAANAATTAASYAVRNYADATAAAAYAADAAGDAAHAVHETEYKQQIQDLKDILQGEV